MDKQGDNIQVNDVEASGGSKEGVVRYVLVIGLVLAIGLLTLIWVTGALTQDEDEQDISVSSQIATEEAGESTDGIVSDDADNMNVETDRDDGAVQTIEN